MRGEPLLGHPNCGGIHKTETDAMANPHRENNEEEVRLQGEEGDRVASDEDKAANSDGHPGTKTLRDHASKDCEHPLGHSLASSEEDKVFVLKGRIIPVLPHVRRDIGVEVGIAVVQGETNIEEESTDYGQNTGLV